MRDGQKQRHTDLRFPERRSSRARVVVENVDAGELWAEAQILRETGYDVVTCEGPERLGLHGCPLLVAGECVAITEADVVILSILHEDGGPEVVDAIRRRHPDTPVVVVAPQPTARHHAELLDGCDVISPMVTATRLVAAVERAIAPVAAESAG